MIERTARCPCSGLSVTVRGDPDRVSVCHCLECKRRTGSAFSWNAHWPEARTRIEGEHRSWERLSEDGFPVRHHFCPDCGVTVFYRIERRPGTVSIPAGGFANPYAPAPAVEVYGELRCPWLPEVAPEQE